MNPFQSLRDYELFVYTLASRFSSILASTLIIAQRSNSFAELTGELAFSDAFRLTVYERLTWDAGQVKIVGYSYEGWREGVKLYWYDSQPHPNDITLQSTHPHHKHIPPDIKHHRIPAPDIGFDQPNLPVLIVEIDKLIGRTPVAD